MSRTPASLEEGFTLCPHPAPDQLVHVEGWDKGCVFKYVETLDGESVLQTPKTGKIYRTKNRLLNPRTPKRRNRHV